MYVDICTYRMRIGLHYRCHLKVKGLNYLSCFESLILLSLVLLQCGDIESNPGPTSSSSLSTPDTSFATNPDEEIIRSKFSIVHYNIQSLSNKLDIIESELKDFDIICLTETWLDRRTTDTDIELNGFKLPYRRDRPGDSHGGICVYVKENIFSKRRPELIMPDIESVWIEVSTRHKKLLLGTFYRAPNSPADALTSIENSIGLAYDTNISNILVTGDFNLDMLQSAPKRKVETLCQQYSLHSLITESTHFTESTSSLIDLFLSSETHNILLSGVGVPFLEQNVRYHCPIYCVLNFDKMIYLH